MEIIRLKIYYYKFTYFAIQQSYSKNKLEEVKFSLNGVVQQHGSIQSVKNKMQKQNYRLEY